MTRRRISAVVAVLATVAIVAPLAWMWWDSRMPEAYNVMDMGYADYGGGPRPASGPVGGHGTGHGSHGGTTGRRSHGRRTSAATRRGRPT